MLRKFFAAIALAGAIVAGQVAEAGFSEYATSNSSFWVSDTPGGSGPVDGITSMSFSSGRFYVNQLGGSPFEVGSTVRGVGGARLSDFDSGAVIPFLPNSSSGLFAIFALEGTTQAAGTARFNSGSVWFVPSQSSFITNAATWSVANAIAKFDLAPPKAIVDGPSKYGISSGSGTQPKPASEVNVSNVGGFSNVNNGVFAFENDDSFNATFGPDGSPWMFDVENPFDESPFDGLAFTTTQSAETNQDNIDSLDLDGLVTAFNELITQSSIDATFFADGDNVWDPKALGQAPTGDFVAQLVPSAAVITGVPEPGSLAIFGLSLLGVGFVARRRMRKVNA